MDPPLYADDIVARKTDPTDLGIVERTPGDIETHSPFPAKDEEYPIRQDASISTTDFSRFIKDGVPPANTVLVRWEETQSLELVPATLVDPIDRPVMIGDIVKRAVNDAESGVVLNTFTYCTLQPVCNVTYQGPCDVTYQGSRKLKGVLPPGSWNPTSDNFGFPPEDQPAQLVDIPASELRDTEPLVEGDLVVYKDWIGRVETISNNFRLRLMNNTVVEIDEIHGRHRTGVPGPLSIGDIAKLTKGDMRRGKWIFGQYNANVPPVGTVVDLRCASAIVMWMERRIGSNSEEPPTELETPELDSRDFKVYDRTRRPDKPNENLHYDTVSNSELEVELHSRVRFRDLNGACAKYSISNSQNQLSRLDRHDHLGYDLNVFDVVSYYSEVTVQWQDLSITRESSISLIPDQDIDDEHGAWPGEIGHTLGLRPVPGMENVEQPDKVGVFQAVNAAERMATINWSSSSYVHYSKDAEDEDGSHRVVSHHIDTSPDLEENISLYDVEAPATLNARRGDILLITNPQHNNMSETSSDMTWLGELVDTPLDGSFVIRLGAANPVQDVVVSRHGAVVAIRSDASDASSAWSSDDSDEDDDWDGSDDDEDEGLDSSEDGDGSDDDEDEELDSSEDGEVPVRYEDENGDPMEEEDVGNQDWESAEEDVDNDGDIEMHNALELSELHAMKSVDSALPGTSTHEGSPIENTCAPPDYLVLEGEAPSDHHYIHEPSTTTPGHIRRTQKEHKILRNPSTIPEGVYIRTWETRLDLLRVLLVGPTETPYASCPFVMDLYLPPNFPIDPPLLFFHSWQPHAKIGGIGRVNPNLYEDGKVCLSILGTWEGDTGETWVAARSTLLQVIVSMLGLVLVREPYFNEAGHETLVGTKAFRRPSALYSERVFLRARGFIITALSSPAPVGLKAVGDIIQWLYLDPSGPQLLHTTIKAVEAVLRESAEESAEPDGLTVLSKGACIPLKRLLKQLKKMQTAEAVSFSREAEN